MKVMLFLLLMFSHSYPSKSKDRIYIYEYYPKIRGHELIIGFVFPDSTLQMVDVSFKVSYIAEGIKDVKRWKVTYRQDVKEINEGIFNNTMRITCYNSVNFAKNTKYSFNTYKLLDRDFLTVDNEQRFRIVERLFTKYSKK